MFDYTSRYYHLSDATYVFPDGRSVVFRRRRFLPQGSSMPLLAESAVRSGERLDVFAHRTLGDPLQFWRVADANDAMNPFDLVGLVGRRLRVPVPQP